MRSHVVGLLLFLSGASAAAAAAQQQAAAGAAAGYMVVELELQSGGDKVTKEAIAKVFTDLGASPDKFNPVLEKRASGADEKVLVTAGDKASCEAVRDKFVAIGMKADVRPLSATDVPSEYDGSDVISAGQAKLSELLESGEGGVLVAFTAPWCKHCHTLVPELKKAATELKGSGIRVVAVNTQTSPQLAQHLGVRMLPTIKWLQMVNDNIAVAEYGGAREAAAIVRFAQAAGPAIAEQTAGDSKDASKEATAAADPVAAKGSKMGMSKLGKSKAAGPDAGESKLKESKVKGSDVAEAAPAGSEEAKGDAAATEGVQKAATPAEATAAA